MTRRRCVVCEERPAQPTLCPQCDLRMEMAPEWDASWAARRARMYERRRWVRMLRLSRCPDAEWLIKNVNVPTKARRR